MMRLLEFASAVAPSVKEHPHLLPELADSVVVLVVARLDGFFNDLISVGTRHRELTVMEYLDERGKKHARTCDVPTLVKLAHQLVSFK
jgi:hypothetical protein